MATIHTAIASSMRLVGDVDGNNRLMTDPQYPDDGAGVIEITALYEADGYGGHFIARANAEIRCDRCGRASPASTATVAQIRRAEGVSDPDDETAIIAMTCPQCHEKGTMVLKYGTGATVEESDVLRELAPVS
jgi:Zn finger protein HypA/HybF involved in hydrogenase expression